MRTINKVAAFLFRRQTAYVKTFSGPVADEVIADLAKFCRADASTFHPDPRISAMLQGRHEVFLRILHHLKLPQDKLYELYSGKTNME